jgi:UDP-GlcNAc:undecaprenyl-phosphate/decaprenyl-phosphate GlcNAc-1-phosphate transferase
MLEELSNLFLVCIGAFCSAFFISILLVPILKRIAFKYSIVDTPNQKHKTHKNPTPYLGGISIVLPIFFLTLVIPFLFSLNVEVIKKSALLVLPSIFLSVVGLFDDVKNLSAVRRLVFQIFASLSVSALLISGGYTARLTSSLILNVLISVVWMVGITNAYNFLDNADGSATGLALIASIGLLVLSINGNQMLISMFASTLAGSTLGFLYWNRHPATIFLGDSGALFIGFVLSVLLLQFEPVSNNQISSVFVPIMVMALPILDTSVVVTSRIVRRVSIFQGGRDHLYHRLISLGLSQKYAVAWIWILSTYFLLIAFAIEFFEFRNEYLLIVLGISSLSLAYLFFMNLNLVIKD